MWTALARAILPVNTAAEASRIDATRYPMPDLTPEGGFVIEKALVYALARKETDFNATARSSVGAYGLMQVMPTTAAELSGDRGFVSNPTRLFDPAVQSAAGPGLYQPDAGPARLPGRSAAGRGLLQRPDRARCWRRSGSWDRTPIPCC